MNRTTIQETRQYIYTKLYTKQHQAESFHHPQKIKQNVDGEDRQHPKVICIGNNPQASNIYSPVISLYLNTFQKLLKEQEEQPCSIILEEFSSISWQGVDKFLAVCRSYLVSVTLIIQDASQLILHYGEKQAKVILSMVGNIISGQVTGESARSLSERFGKIMQDRQSITINSSDTSVNKSRQLDYAIPQSTIASLSAGEVVGMVADDPEQPIPQKMFHSRIQYNFEKLKQESESYQDPPKRNVPPRQIKETYLRIKREAKIIVREELERLMTTPGQAFQILKKP